MSSGTDSIQTDKGEDFLALLAKAWATSLLCRFTWEKEQVKKKKKKPIRDLQSFTMCPILDRSEQSLDNAFTIFSESLSKMARHKPNSSMKIIALLAAIASRISTLGGMTNFFAKDAITYPSLFLTTTPIPTFYSSAKYAPS